MFYSIPCKCVRPKGYKQQCYTKYGNVNRYNKIFTNKAH